MTQSQIRSSGSPRRTLHPQKVTHLDQRFSAGRTPVRLLLVGAGGTGSKLLDRLIHLHFGLRAFSQPGLDVTVIDPDRVSPSNLVRQLFRAADIGHPKAEVLVERINLSTGLSWKARNEAFKPEHLQSQDIVVSCVDTAAARADLHAALQAPGTVRYWCDTANGRSGGQIMIGEPESDATRKLNRRLPLPSELLPELIVTRAEELTTPSCSAIESLAHQDLLVNDPPATAAAQLLWNLLHNGELPYSGQYFNLASGIAAPVPSRHLHLPHGSGTKRAVRIDDQLVS